jgi:hypothetical protein
MGVNDDVGNTDDNWSDEMSENRTKICGKGTFAIVVFLIFGITIFIDKICSMYRFVKTLNKHPELFLHVKILGHFISQAIPWFAN